MSDEIASIFNERDRAALTVALGTECWACGVDVSDCQHADAQRAHERRVRRGRGGRWAVVTGGFVSRHRSLAAARRTARRFQSAGAVVRRFRRSSFVVGDEGFVWPRGSRGSQTAWGAR